MKCIIITIGDELLIGQTIDTNSAFIAQQLSALGISIHRRIAIADSAEDIQNTILDSWKQADIIITTGGLGPTKDDITKKTLCDLFQVSMRRDEQTYEHVKAFFEARHRPFLPVNEGQADVPSNAEVLFNARGTAPGMWIEDKGKILISLPGVPYEMEHLIKTHVLEKLKVKFKIPALYYFHIQTAGIGESFLAEKIQDIENELPSYIGLAYLPSPMAVNLRLSGHESNQSEIDLYGQKIAQTLEEFVYGFSTVPIEELVFQKLKDRQEKITLVESCTGGFLSSLLTNIKGSSEVYVGGWNVYSDEFKHRELEVSEDTLSQYSSVSEACGKELLIHALEKTKADFGISVVGHLEKSESVQNPFAIITYGNIVNQKMKTLDLFYPRIKSKEAIAKAAFVGLYRDFLLN